MYSYNNLSIEIMNDDISNIDKQLIPVNIDQIIKINLNWEHYRNIVVTKLYHDCFEYEYVNQQLTNPNIDRMIISYGYMRVHGFMRNKTLHINSKHIN